MTITERTLTSWVELVHDLLHDAPVSRARQVVAEHLLSTFDAPVSYAEVAPHRSVSITFPDRDASWVPDDFEARFFRPVLRHPLALWLLWSGDVSATTVARVPSSVVPPHLVGEMVEFLRPLGVEHQLAMPCEITDTSHCGYFVATTGQDFTECQLEMARAIQPLLILLHRHLACLDSASEDAECSDLTVRERAVLDLVGQGMTSDAIAHRLSISARTVQKHLENAYRKLDVHDRVSAVLSVRRREHAVEASPAEVVPGPL